eukprot:5604445-Alexandrium_andersonii.AAC.1
MLVDPVESVFVKCQASFRQMLLDWNMGPGSSWELLGSMRLLDIRKPEIMLFARRQVLTLSASLFRRADMKFSSFPYRLH